jgi:hypothetical protein
MKGIETAESDALMSLYDRTLKPETTRAVLAIPGSAEQLAALPLAAEDVEIRGAEVPELGRFLEGMTPPRIVQTVLENGLHVTAVQRPNARFQTALLGFFDGTARVPPAVVDAARWSYRSFIVEPPTGVLQLLHWDEDATRRIVRGPAGDTRVLLRRLAEGLDNYDFEWKNERFLDFTAGEKKRENDPRESTPRAFRKQLFLDHPYGIRVVSTDIDAVTVPQIRTWYDAVHRPENALLVLVGPERPETLLEAAGTELGRWQRQARREPPVAPRSPLQTDVREGPRLLVGDRPTESQVTLDAGCVLPPGTRDTAAVEDVLVSLLGAKLKGDLRERAGATYGVQVRAERLRGGTEVIHARTAVANELLGPSLKTFRSWFLEDGEVPTEDAVKLARFSALKRYVVGTEPSVDLAALLFDYARRDLAPRDFEQHPRRIAEVDLPAVLRLLAACRRTSLFSAVGDERRIRAAWQGH